jgi:hypothetical protein
MNEWDATSYEAKDNLLRVLRREADALFEMAENGPWTGATACTKWETRDIVGHLIDVTESYFTSFDAARSGAAVLGPDEWGGLMVPHKYMGPLPAFFYPWFQLVDYGVHGWDIRQGTGRAHGMGGDAADLLTPLMFILWQATADVPSDMDAYAVGIRVSGRNAKDYLVNISVDGLSYAQDDVSGLPAVIEFDAASLVLTAYGRVNAGTIRGDRAVADQFLNSFFRI